MSGPFYPFYEGPAFCVPKSGLGSGEDYLGEILSGSRLVNTPISFKINQDQQCIPLCEPITSTGENEFPGLSIKPSDETDHRRFPLAEVMVDNLPVISKIKLKDLPYHVKTLIDTEFSSKPETEFYAHGVPLFDSVGVVLNHWKVTIQLEPTASYQVEGGFFGIGGQTKEETKYTVVGAIVEAESVADISQCNSTEGNKVVLSTGEPVQWFYSVKFAQVQGLSYATRWNTALSAIQHGLSTMDGKSAFGDVTSENSKRWLDVILDTSIIAVCMVLVVTWLMARMLKHDFDQEETVLGEEIGDMSTWKLLKSDVFRKPPHSTILCALVGGGLQIIIALVPVSVALLTGVIPEEHKGRVIQLGIVSWAVAGLPAGYAVCRLYRMFESPNWKLTVIRTGLLVPGCSLVWALVINFATYGLSVFNKSPVPRVLDTWAIFRLAGFWVFFSLPLVSAGCYFGLRSDAPVPPIKPSKIPRPCPPMNVSYLVIMLTAGSLIHAGSMALVDSLIKVLLRDYNSDSVVQVSIAFLIWCIITGLVSVCTTFYFINDDIWSWWWYSYTAPASCGLWIAVLLLFESQHRVHTVLEGVVYFGLVGMVSVSFSLIAGAIGFLSSLIFMFHIYSRIRVD
eukprot:GHVH01006436.1.p1 GENE.GHVH01006436.1~~GHVH01006436.1.p1  ORF type:complete len:677 (+),score=75.28 GHVH01006436.1:163-2031(+)